jgi:hypothetical protein
MTETVILYCSDTCLYTSGYSVSQGVCPLGKDCQGFDHMNNIFCNSPSIVNVRHVRHYRSAEYSTVLPCPKKNENLVFLLKKSGIHLKCRTDGR